jgi:hypothetical protein
MKYFLLLIPFLSFAQKDTVFTQSGGSIPCSITFVNSNNIFYNTKSSDGNMIEMFKVKAFSQNGKRSSSVTISPVYEQTVTVAQEFEYMRNCFARQHAQYITGTAIGCIGIATVGGSFFINTDENAPRTFAGIGSALIFIGTIVVMDSHKWVKRAALGVSGKGSSVAIFYKF